MKTHIRNTGLILLLVSLLYTPSGAWNQAHAAAARTINFSGYTWTVKNGFYGPGPNNWSSDPSAVFVDQQGQLHLKVIKRDGKWYSSEVYLPQSLGYGLYSFDIVSRVDLTDTNLVAAPFLYQDDTREYDIEFSNWKTLDGQNSSYTVQPYTKAGNVSQFSLALQNGVSTHTIDWQQQMVAFASSQNNLILNQWSYIGADIFAPGAERVHINFWMIDGSAPSDGQEKELIIKSFVFKPSFGVYSSVPTAQNIDISTPVFIKSAKRIDKPLQDVKKQINLRKNLSGHSRNVWTNLKRLRYSF